MAASGVLSVPAVSDNDRWLTANWALLLSSLFLLALGLRLIFILATPSSSPYAPNLREYEQRAGHWRSGHGMVMDPVPPSHHNSLIAPWRAFRRPLTVLTIAALQSLFGPENSRQQRAFFALLGAWAVVCVAQSARLWWGYWPGLVAGVWYMSYPYNVVHDTALYDNSWTNLCVSSFILTMAVWQKRPRWTLAAVLGFIAGIFSLNRFDGIFLAILSPVYMSWWLRASLTRRAVQLAAFLIPVLICLLPWLFYVHETTGHWSLGSGGGLGLWATHNDSFYQHYPRKAFGDAYTEHWRLLPPEERSALLSSKDEFSANRLLKRSAYDWISANPRKTLALIPRRIASGFSPLLSPQDDFNRFGRWKRRLYTMWFAPVLLGAAIAAFRFRLHVGLWIPALLPLVGFILVTALTYAHTRHRAAYDGALFLLAAGALAPSGWREPDFEA